MANALLVLDAQIEIDGPAGPRSLPLASLHREPGATPSVETDLADGELVIAVRVPIGAPTRRSHYVKVRDRASFEWAIASAAVMLDVRDGEVHEARIAVGGVATRPWRLPAVEAQLRGRRLTEDVCREAAGYATEGATCRAHNTHKPELLRRTVARALQETAGLP